MRIPISALLFAASVATSAPVFAAETTAVAAKAASQFDAVTPVSRDSLPWWKARHELIVKRATTGTEKVKIVFVGDSITEGWEGAGKAVWAENFAKYDALNLGIGGDRTEHVLWRLENGEWPAALKPKVVVVMIGTNNTGAPHAYPPEATADGVKHVVEKIRALSPGSVILLHPIFPRGATPGDRLRLTNDKVNVIIAKLADGVHVKLVDFGARFLDQKGNLPRLIMPDLLHPDAAGYKIWADALAPEIAGLIPTETK